MIHDVLQNTDNFKFMSEHLPHARLVLLLRNPIDRAFSEYHMKVWDPFDLIHE